VKCAGRQRPGVQAHFAAWRHEPTVDRIASAVENESSTCSKSAKAGQAIRDADSARRAIRKPDRRSRKIHLRIWIKVLSDPGVR